MAAVPKSPEWQGVYAAAITPRGERGEVNFGAAFEMIDYLCAARVSGIALFTAWGEYPAFSVEDRARLTHLAVKRSRAQVTVGVGSTTLDQSVELARHARQAGASALHVPAPNFYRYDSDDIREYYSQFAAQLGGGIPLLLSAELDGAILGELLDSGKFESIENSDRHFVQARCRGQAAISAAACAAPELVMALNAAICNGHQDRIERLELVRQELVEWLDRFPQPVGLKAAVAARGLKVGPLSVPLSPAKQQCLDVFRTWLQTWLPSTRKLAACA